MDKIAGGTRPSQDRTVAARVQYGAKRSRGLSERHPNIDTRGQRRAYESARFNPMGSKHAGHDARSKTPKESAHHSPGLSKTDLEALYAAAGVNLDGSGRQRHMFEEDMDAASCPPAAKAAKRGAERHLLGVGFGDVSPIGKGAPGDEAFGLAKRPVRHTPTGTIEYYPHTHTTVINVTPSAGTMHQVIYNSGGDRNRGGQARVFDASPIPFSLGAHDKDTPLVARRTYGRPDRRDATTALLAPLHKDPEAHKYLNLPLPISISGDPEGRSVELHQLLSGSLDQALSPLTTALSSGDNHTQLAGLQILINTLTDVAKALQILHREGLVHRDVKPGNILLNGRGESVLCDFGCLGTEMDIASGGPAQGTDWYMAPEARSTDANPERNRRVDIYSFGRVIQELLNVVDRDMPHTPEGYESPVRLFKDLRLRTAAAEDVTAGLKQLAAFCMKRTPKARPNVDTILTSLSKLRPLSHAGIVDRICGKMLRQLNLRK